jgi:hypothetical protein
MTKVLPLFLLVSTLCFCLAFGGFLGNNRRPCFKRNANRTEFVTTPQPKDYLRDEDVPGNFPLLDSPSTTFDFRV